jgi:hypothetical protein
MSTKHLRVYKQCKHSQGKDSDKIGPEGESAKPDSANGLVHRLLAPLRATL